MEWIKVEDRLPETGKSYLIVNDAGSVYLASFDGETFCYLFDNPAIYWMPLPLPPLSQHNQYLIKSLNTLPEK